MHIALAIVGLIGVLLLGALLPYIDGNKRVNGGEWRVRPSRSGKTWEVYRYSGFGREEKYTRFKSAEAAADFIRRNQAESR